VVINIAEAAPMNVKKLLLGLTLSLLLGNGAVVASNYHKGLKAYEANDFNTALLEWIPLAEQGLAKAQHKLGYMYDVGEGVLENDKTAVKWYTQAAEQGLAKAQYNLAYMYNHGHGVAENIRPQLSGIAKRLSKGLLKHNITWAICTIMAMVLQRTHILQLSGSP